MDPKPKGDLLHQLAASRPACFFDGLTAVVSELIGARLSRFDLDDVERRITELQPAILAAFECAGCDQQGATNAAYRLRFAVIFRLEDILNESDLAQVEKLYETVRGPNFREDAAMLIVTALRQVAEPQWPALAHRIAVDLAFGRVLAGDADADAAHADAKAIERAALVEAMS